MNDKYKNIKKINKIIYDKLRKNHNKLPLYPLQYYKLNNGDAYDSLLSNSSNAIEI